MSPITHLGCFLTPSKTTSKALQKCLKDFCKDKLNVAQARLTVPVTSGGMGLLDVEEFLIAQQASWIFRTKKSCRDNWRNDVMVLSHGNALAFSPQNTNPVRHPILFNLAKSYERVRILFDKKMRITIMRQFLTIRCFSGNREISKHWIRHTWKLIIIPC